MTTELDKFLRKTLVKQDLRKQTEQKPLPPVFTPVMTLDRFSEVSGLPRGVLKGHVERSYIPTTVLGRRKMVNVSLLNALMLRLENMAEIEEESN